MSLDCRIASLLAFYESRNCDDADKGPGGQFTKGNDCGGGGAAAAGGDSQSEPARPRVIPLPKSGRVDMNAEKLSRSPPFHGAEKLKSLSIDSVENVRAAQKKLGDSTVGEIAKILVADVENAHVTLTTDEEQLISQVALRVDQKDETKGKVTLTTAVRYTWPTSISYETFTVSAAAKKSVSSVAFANDIMDLMLDSLEQAEKSGIEQAETFAAGNRADREWQGYRLWGKFGFDAEIPPTIAKNIPDDVLGRDGLAAREAEEPITLQQLLATPKGTKWWQRNGSQLKMRLDFTDKKSDGYKRFKRLLAIRKRHRERGGEKRSFMQWLYETDDVSEQSLIEYRNCGTGAGGFQKDNDCGTGSAKQPVEVPKNVRRNGDQTGVARKLYSIGTTERKVSELIGELGGSPKLSTVDINGNRVNVHIRDKSGKNLYFMEIRYSGARLYPLEAKGKLSQGDAKKFAESVRKAMPAKYGKKTDQDFKVSVMKDPEDFKQWQREDDERIKSVEDKYRFSLELPPHQRPKKSQRSLELSHASLLAFAEARNCGTGAGGFQKGNSCGGGSLKTQEGSVTSAAKGAVSGAVKGAATGFAVGGVAGLAPGAATGAVIGAARGIYDDKMRPTRVSKRLESYGVTESKISSLVKKLGGSSESSAKLARRSVVVDVKDDSGKKLFKVEIENSEVTIYPSSKTGKLSDGELKKVKELAREFVPQQVNVVVKPSNTAYTKKLIGKGMKIAAKAAGLYVAHWTVPAVLGEVEGSLGKYRKEDMGRKPRKDW